jgi:hypothetical protein
MNNLKENILKNTEKINFVETLNLMIFIVVEATINRALDVNMYPG